MTAGIHSLQLQSAVKETCIGADTQIFAPLHFQLCHALKIQRLSSVTTEAALKHHSVSVN